MLARPKFAFPPDEIAAVLSMFRSRGELFPPMASAVASSDPGDTKFLQCAETAQADCIVTGNKRHFPVGSSGVTRIVNAGELLDRITLENMISRPFAARLSKSFARGDWAASYRPQTRAARAVELVVRPSR